MNITKISIERPTLLGVTFFLLIFMGILSYTQLSYELVPKFTPPLITVVTIYPGASPQEVEDDVSLVIEGALSSLENVELIRTTSRESFSLVKLELKAGTDTDITIQEAQRKLIAIRRDLPSSAEAPTLSRFDVDDLPIMRMGLYADLDEVSFSRFCQEEIIPELSKISGVAQVRLLGEQEEEIRVSMDPHKMELYGVSIMQVVKAVNSSNMNVPAGFVQNDELKKELRLNGRFQDVEDLKDLVVFQNLQLRKFVQLKDIAEVGREYKERKAISRIDGVPAIGLDLKKQANANAVDVSEDVIEAVQALETKYQDIALDINIAQNTSEFTKEAADAVMTDLFLAIILVSLVMLVFLHSLRSAMIVFVSIPTSIISTFIIMNVLGYTLNLLSLLGLSLAIGILVDDAIVVLENIYRHLEMGKDKKTAAYEGRMEIGFTAVSITLIDVVVFLPIVLAEGLVADLLRQFSVVIVTSTLFSLFVSFTLVPYLVSRYGKISSYKEQGWTGRFLTWFEAQLDDLIAWLLNALDWSFNHKRKLFAITTVLLLASVSLIPLGYIGIEFTKAGDRGEILFEMELPKDTPLDQTVKVTLQVENYLRSIPEVASVLTSIGTTSSGRITSNSSYLAEFSAKLVPKEDRKITTAQLARVVKQQIQGNMPGLLLRPIEINILGLRSDDAVEVMLLGNEMDSLESFHAQAYQKLIDIPGTVEEVTSLSIGAPVVEVKIDRQKAQLLGINVAQAGIALRTAFFGNDMAKFYEEEGHIPILIRLDDFNRQNIDDVRALTILNNRGQAIPLGQFTSITEEEGVATLERTNRSRSITLKSQVIGKPAGSISANLRSELENLDLPEGVSYIFGGESKRTTDGLKTMILSFVVSILLVYLVLVALYDSYIYPFVVLFSIPLAVIGALLALGLSQQSLSIFSILGMVMLVGLVGKNAILVVDFTNELRKKGMELKEALRESTKLRFRPILMTNLTMVIGLLPIALAQGAGSEWKNGLAWALIGGLSSSMFLTLLIVPVVYYLVEKAKSKWEGAS